MPERILSFRELRIYHLAFEVQQEIFEVTRRFPTEERYALTDQIRRASRSMGANVSEAWQKRRYLGHFIIKLTDADDEQAESQHWLATAAACNYLSREKPDLLIDKCRRIGRMLGTMMGNPEKWRLATGEAELRASIASSPYAAGELVRCPSSVIGRPK